MLRAVWFAFWESRKADAVFVYHTGPLTQALAIIPIKLLRRSPVTIWTQDVWPDAVFAYGFPERGAFAILLKQFVKIIYHFCDTILVTSPGFIERVRSFAQHKTIEFVPQWVPDEVLKREPAPFVLDGPGTKFIFTGNVGSMQALEIVLKAFAELKNENVVFYILGDGNKRRDFEKLAETLGAENVKFLGSVHQNQVLMCIEQCDFTVLSLSPNPLISLTIPAKFQTYLAAGKPILAITNGEVATMVKTLGLGLAAAPSVDAVVEVINELISTKKSEYPLWEKNVRSAQALFKRERCIEKITDSFYHTHA